MVLLKIMLAPEGAFVSTVANHLYIDTLKASRIVDSLVEANLVKRVYEKLSDRRKIQLMPTKEGRLKKSKKNQCKQHESFLKTREKKLKS